LDGFSAMIDAEHRLAATIVRSMRRGMTVPLCRKPTRHPRMERGAAAVEFALVAAMLIMIMFGVISVGIVLTQKVTLGSAVRDGARFGSVNIYGEAVGSQRKCEDVVDYANYNASTIGMGEGLVYVTVKRGEKTGTVQESFNAATDVCGESAAGSTGDDDEYPCEGAGDLDNLYVRATFDSSINIPLVATRTVTLTSYGVYRCEYS
jgi:Flp pilus assembly protein TadG